MFNFSLVLAQTSDQMSSGGSWFTFGEAAAIVLVLIVLIIVCSFIAATVRDRDSYKARIGCPMFISKVFEPGDILEVRGGFRHDDVEYMLVVQNGRLRVVRPLRDISIHGREDEVFLNLTPGKYRYIVTTKVVLQGGFAGVTRTTTESLAYVEGLPGSIVANNRPPVGTEAVGVGPQPPRSGSLAAC